jgi:hypothetical protein
MSPLSEEPLDTEADESVSEQIQIPVKVHMGLIPQDEDHSVYDTLFTIQDESGKSFFQQTISQPLIRNAMRWDHRTLVWITGRILGLPTVIVVSTGKALQLSRLYNRAIHTSSRIPSINISLDPMPNINITQVLMKHYFPSLNKTRFKIQR